MRKSELQVRVNFGETDGFGIVYYPNYFRWFDNATYHFFREMDVPLHELLKKSLSLFRYWMCSVPFIIHYIARLFLLNLK
ncbi:acyl-CoA thioesterase [Alteribacillus sp. JSM 102045]|uniref:acyl-CoA thioesterase n=1 Tax=Alteribacillus sp. JSM 102045 TaxID=1562101 RepID=UPI0035C0E6A7